MSNDTVTISKTELEDMILAAAMKLAGVNAPVTPVTPQHTDVTITIDGKEFVASYGTFSTGSRGWRAGGTCTLQGEECTVNVLLTVKGSKKETGAADRAEAAAMAKLTKVANRVSVSPQDAALQAESRQHNADVAKIEAYNRLSDSQKSKLDKAIVDSVNAAKDREALRATK